MGKKVLIATGLGFVALWVLGFLIYGLLLSKFMQKMMEAAGDCVSMDGSMVLITVAMLIQALFLALVLDKFGSNNFQSGLIAAAWVTLLISVMMGLWSIIAYPYYGTTHLLFDVLSGTVHGALGGGIIGWSLGRFK